MKPSREYILSIIYKALNMVLENLFGKEWGLQAFYVLNKLM